MSVSESADLLGVDVAVRRADHVFKASIKVWRSGCFQQFVDASFTPGRDFFIECVKHFLGKRPCVECGVVGDVDDASAEGSHPQRGEVGQDGFVKEAIRWRGW